MTDRDEDILKFINEFGFVGLDHLMKRFSIKESNGYKITKRLMNEGLINFLRIYHNKKGVYSLTVKGASWTDLPPLSRVSEFKYKHNLKLIDVYLYLLSKYPSSSWISERRIIADEYSRKSNKRKHLPDGFLILPDLKQIAIEVELTLKNKERLAKIFKYYGIAEEPIEEVWYYCSPDIIKTLEALSKNKPYIKIFSLEEILL